MEIFLSVQLHSYDLQVQKYKKWVQKKINDVYLNMLHSNDSSIEMKARRIASSRFASSFLALFFFLISLQAEVLNFRKVDMTSGMSFNSVLCLMD